MKIEQLLEELKSKDPNVRRQAIVELGRKNDPGVIEAITPLLSDPDAAVRYFAKKTLVSLKAAFEKQAAKGTKHPSAVHSSEVSTRPKLKDDSAIESKSTETGEGIQDSKIPVENMKSKGGIPEEVRAEIDRIMSIGQSGDRSGLPELIRRLEKEQDRFIRATLIKAIGQLGDESVVPNLIPHLKDPDPRVVANTVEALEEIGSPKGHEAMLELLTHRDNRVKANIAKALWKFSQTDLIGSTLIMDNLRNMLLSKEPWLQESAIYVLGEIGTEKALGLIKLVLNDEDDYIRHKARETLEAKTAANAAKNQSATSQGSRTARTQTTQNSRESIREASREPGMEAARAIAEEASRITRAGESTSPPASRDKQKESERPRKESPPPRRTIVRKGDSLVLETSESSGSSPVQEKLKKLKSFFWKDEKEPLQNIVTLGIYGAIFSISLFILLVGIEIVDILIRGQTKPRPIQASQSSIHRARADKSLSLEEARESINVGNYDIAIKVADTMLSQSPDNPEAISLRVAASTAKFNQHLKKKDLTGALAVASELCTRLPMVAEARVLYGEAALLTGDRGKAREEFMKALESSPGELIKKRIFTGLGQCHHAEKNYDAAIAEFKKALEIDTNDAEVLFSLGSCYAFKNENALALKMYSKAIEKDPYYPLPHIGLGIIHAKENRLDEALREFTMAYQIDPTIAVTYFEMGKVYEAQRKNREALYAYQRATELDPEQAAYLHKYGSLLLASGMARQALPLLEKSYKLGETGSELMLDLGLAYHNTNNLEQAEKIYTEALQKDPNNAKLLYNMGVLMDDLKRTTEAIEHYSRAIEIDEKRENAYINLSNAHLEEKNFRQAEEWARRGLKLFPESAPLYFNLAIAQYNQKKKEDSIASFRKIIFLEKAPQDLKKRAKALIDQIGR